MHSPGMSTAAAAPDVAEGRFRFHEGAYCYECDSPEVATDCSGCCDPDPIAGNGFTRRGGQCCAGCGEALADGAALEGGDRKPRAQCIRCAAYTVIYETDAQDDREVVLVEVIGKILGWDFDRVTLELRSEAVRLRALADRLPDLLAHYTTRAAECIAEAHARELYAAQRAA